MPANPNGFEHWSRGGAPSTLAGKASSGTMEYWSRGLALRLLATVVSSTQRVWALFVG